MAICKFCGEKDIPHLKLFKHWNDKHPEEMQKIRHKTGKVKAKGVQKEHPQENPSGEGKLKADVTMNPVQAAIMEFVGEKLQLPMTPALIYRWKEIFGDEALTGALLDRLTHRCHILEMNGASYRFKESLRRKKKDVN